MPSHIVDASVVVRSLLAGPHRDQAIGVLASNVVVAPDLVVVETANALWKYVRSGQLAAADASSFVSDVPRLFEYLVPVVELVETAFDLACRHNHPAYDCFYLALALREELPLVTADRRLAALGDQVGVGTVLLP